jgi:hypothetical protein
MYIRMYGCMYRTIHPADSLSTLAPNAKPGGAPALNAAWGRSRGRRVRRPRRGDIPRREQRPGRVRVLRPGRCRRAPPPRRARPRCREVDPSSSSRRDQALSRRRLRSDHEPAAGVAGPRAAAEGHRGGRTAGAESSCSGYGPAWHSRPIAGDMFRALCCAPAVFFVV